MSLLSADINILKEVHAELTRTMYAFGEGQDPDGTQFEFCRYCGNVEWRKHEPQCKGVELLRKLEHVINSWGRKRS